MATSFHKVNNNAASTLNAAIDDNDLSLAVPTGEGAEFDSVPQYLTLGRSDTYNGEIVDVASRSSDTFTITTRGVDGTSATAHDAGDRVECLLVAAHITEIQDAINAIENGTVTLAKVITSGTAANTHTIADSATNTVVSVLELYHMSSGTPAAGLGAKLLLGAEDSAGNAEAAVELHGILTTVTNTSEQGKFLLRVKNAGSFMDALQITVASNAVTIGSNQTTATLWNTTSTTVNAFGAATTIVMATTPTSDAGLTLGNGTTVGTYVRKFALNIPATANNQGQVQWQWAGTPKWTLYNVGNADSLLFFSHTAAGNILTLGTAGITVGGTLTVTGSGSVFGDASTDTFTFTGRMIVRSVTDAGPMTNTNGSQREIVFNTSDSKFYGCTVTGTPATWAALN